MPPIHFCVRCCVSIISIVHAGAMALYMQSGMSIPMCKCICIACGMHVHCMSHACNVRTYLSYYFRMLFRPKKSPLAGNHGFDNLEKEMQVSGLL